LGELVGIMTILHLSTRPDFCVETGMNIEEYFGFSSSFEAGDLSDLKKISGQGLIDKKSMGSLCR
jgi:hypothetical protein